MTSGAARSPRVLVLTADYAPRSWSGIGVAVARQARALAQLGMHVDVVVAGERELPPDGPRLRLHRLSRSHFPIDPGTVDHVHVHSLRLAELAIELRRRFAVPLTCTVHGWPHCEQPGNARAWRWSRVQYRLLRESDRVVFLSRAERDLGLRLVPAAEGKSFIIPHGVPPPIPSPRQGGRRSGPIVFAGRFAAGKGVDLFAEVAGRLLRARRARVLIAGGHGDAHATALISGLAARFPGSCLAPGWLEPVVLHACFARASAVLVPSAYEPFGLTALEALHMGSPVIAADVGGLRDIVGGTEGGRLIGSRDPREWEAAVLDLLARPAADGAALGAASIARRFPLETSTRRLIREVYGADV